MRKTKLVVGQCWQLTADRFLSKRIAYVAYREGECATGEVGKFSILMGASDGVKGVIRFLIAIALSSEGYCNSVCWEIVREVFFASRVVNKSD